MVLWWCGQTKWGFPLSCTTDRLPAMLAGHHVHPSEQRRQARAWLYLTVPLLLATWSCEGVTEIAGAPCDPQHPCPGAFACVDGACLPTGRLACENDEQCPVGVCDTKAGFCVTCMTKEQCPAGVCHPTAHICVGCMSDSDCTGGVCLPQSRTCVGCRIHSDCPTHLCNVVTHICLGCKGDQQCPNGNCNQKTGVCEDSSTDGAPARQGVVE